MAKAPVVKFPRIIAGFYTVTLDGELVGYIAKAVDGKDVSWNIYDTNEPDLTLETLPNSALIEETELFREAKENAKQYFLNRPVMEEETEQEVVTVELQEPDWTEEETLEFTDELNDVEEMEVEAELAAV